MDHSVRLLTLNWVLGRPVNRRRLSIVYAATEYFRAGINTSSSRDALAKMPQDIIWLFICTSEDLRVDDIEQAIKRVVAGCVNIIGLPQPSVEEIDEAVRKARNYAPQTKKLDDKQTKKQVALFRTPPRS